MTLEAASEDEAATLAEASQRAAGLTLTEGDVLRIIRAADLATVDRLKTSDGWSPLAAPAA